MDKLAFKCFFVDICGNLKEKILFADNLQSLLLEKPHFDGSSVLGFSDCSNSDLKLLPDKNAVYKNNIVFCDASHGADSRLALKQAVSFAKSFNYTINIGAEIEFYLFRKQENVADMIVRDKKSYMSCCSDRIHNFANKVIKNLSKYDISLEAIHHEASNNQYEINFRFGDSVNIADKVVLIKQELKWLAEKSGIFVSFMPKPFPDSAGSGMHINVSVMSNGQNVFAGKDGISETAVHFANGVMNHINAISAFASPTINSYKRLNAGTECPNKIFMSKNDRNALIRIPLATGNATRLEIRSPDISANPYTTFASIIYAGINGIIKKEPCFVQNSFLPSTLNESLTSLAKDSLFNQTFPTLVQKYITVKQQELSDFNNHITDFELKRYF